MALFNFEKKYEEKQSVIDRFISGESSANILADTGKPMSTFYGWLHA